MRKGNNKEKFITVLQSELYAIIKEKGNYIWRIKHLRPTLRNNNNRIVQQEEKKLTILDA